ncbi:MAG: hypothetical protein ACPLPS_04750 [bacterium]
MAALPTGCSYDYPASLRSAPLQGRGIVRSEEENSTLKILAQAQFRE